MTANLQREILTLTIWMFFMLIVGLFADAVFLFLFFGLLVYVVWNLYNLNKLSQWLSKPSKQTPEASGIWDDVYYQLYHLYKRQRKARQKLTSILARFQKSTQALPYGTIVLNEFNEIEWFNPAASNLFELDNARDIGQRIDNLIRIPAFTRYLKKREFEKPLEFIFNRKKLLLNVTAYGSGQYLISARDVTSLSQLDDMRRDFISNASHELRTPLTVMSGYIEFLQHKADTSTEEPLEKIQQQILRMNTIIAELIELAKLESSAVVDHMVEIDMLALLNEVYKEGLSLDNKEHNIKLIISVDNQEIDITDDQYKNKNFMLRGSYEEVRTAVSNLLVNAIRYTPANREIKLFASVTESCVSIGVEDNGVGINYEHIPRLTERFYRVDEGRSREKGGTGLGLSIVKHVLDRHDAYLHISSELGKGSIFRCDFPVSHTEH